MRTERWRRDCGVPKRTGGGGALSPSLASMHILWQLKEWSQTYSLPGHQQQGDHLGHPVPPNEPLSAPLLPKVPQSGAAPPCDTHQ